MTDLERRFEELRQFNKSLDESRDENIRDESMIFIIDSTKHDIIELAVDQYLIN